MIAPQPTSFAIGNSALEIEDRFLKWFSDLGLPLNERRLAWGGLEYFRFSSFERLANGSLIDGYGRANSRRLSLIKCAAEMIERRVMVDFIRENAGKLTSVDAIDLRTKMATPTLAKVPRRDLASSNGWAVHFDSKLAQEKAVSEALERHLLLKSYLKFSWQGFSRIDVIETPELHLSFCLARYVHEGRAAGLVAAKSKNYAGYSFGYCFGDPAHVAETSFWESAIYEAIDKVLVLNGKEIDLSVDPNSWITRGIKHYLESELNLGLLGSNQSEILNDNVSSTFVKTLDLSSILQTPFPLFAAFAWGEEIIPLFNRDSLTAESRQSLEGILRRNGIMGDIPVRHPIL